MSPSKTPKGRAPVASGARRSPCPVSCCLDLLGDKWSLLVVRDLILGRTRFKEFVASPEGIPTNILSERLERLGQAEIIRQIPAEDGTKRMAYQLTEKGEALRPVILAMRDWGLRWQEGAEALLQPKSH
ncbi:MAG: helix-turn-helix domain-containing protein [Verrucomicrobiota bacterium]